MTVAELRAKLADLPDEWPVLLEEGSMFHNGDPRLYCVRGVEHDKGWRCGGTEGVPVVVVAPNHGWLSDEAQI
jgi:hypothetical protein